VLVFKVQPSEFWQMTMGEWWTLYDMHVEQSEASTNAASGKTRSRLTRADKDRLHRGLMDALAKEKKP
jgi:hypothetical protein